MRRRRLGAYTYLFIVIVCVLYLFLRSGLKSTSDQIEYNILQWTVADSYPFNDMGTGQRRFLENKCKYTNCYITHFLNAGGSHEAQSFYNSKWIRQFHAIIFTLPEVFGLSKLELPQFRYDHQKYVFASTESASDYPVCNERFDGYFNWTWTYKLDSDLILGAFVIRDSNHSIIGPKQVMHWKKMEEMDIVSNEVRDVIQGKTKAAVWFVNDCRAKKNNIPYAKLLQIQLRKQSYDLDVYGACGEIMCDMPNGCEKKIETDYYFYLYYENSFTEDYVTEDLLLALDNTAIPIVYGGANYSRFMPDGAYLDAYELGLKRLAAKMVELINDPDEYIQYFRWKGHYSYHRTNTVGDTNAYCQMCELLNTKESYRTHSQYDNFSDWWGSSHCSVWNLTES